jgi:uncharacterized membrane protein
MLRVFANPFRLVLFLGFCTFIPVMMAAVRVVQVPMGMVPEDTLRLMVAPISLFLHAVAGVAFGIAGPIQFSGVLRERFGVWHRATGRIFVVSGLFLGLSGLSLLVRVDSISTPMLDTFRGIMSFALCLSLALGLAAIQVPDVTRHRAWMIRAYVIGMGSGTVALVMFPIYIATGEPPTGWVLDSVFVGWWALNICLGELVIRQSAGANRPNEATPDLRRGPRRSERSDPPQPQPTSLR